MEELGLAKRGERGEEFGEVRGSGGDGVWKKGIGSVR